MSEDFRIVRLLDLDDEFIIDLKYATDDNFTGQIIYSSRECYIYEKTAKLLIEAKNIFKGDGYRVKVWDAYRPISAQSKLYEVYPIDEFVAPPPDLSKPIDYTPSHMNGMSVDITLVDRYGNEIFMPTEFDAFVPEAGLGSDNIPDIPRENAAYLCRVMESVGFEAYEYEWWHFSDNHNEPMPYSDLVFK